MLSSSTFEVPSAQWEAAKAEAKAIMIERARTRGLIPYSDLVSQITSLKFQAHDLHLFRFLDEISSEEDSAGRGLLTVIVVHKAGDMKPGPGFFELAKSRGRETRDLLRCWITELNCVHAIWYKPVERVSN